STAGSALQLAKALESGNPQAIMTAGQGLINNVNNLTAKSDVANLLINSKDIGAIDADAGGITSPFTKLQPPGSPTEDELIGQQQRTNNANQALADYLGPGSDLSREGLVNRLTAIVGADQAEVLAKEADKQLLGADVMKRYSVMDPEFGVPVLDRNTAIDEMVAGGWDRTSASRMLDQVDAENVVKSQSRLEVQGAYRDLIAGRGSEEQLTRAMMVVGYTDKEIENTILKARSVIEGQNLTPGETAQERAANLPDIRAEIAGKSTFGEAYATAREKLGANATFTWQGKDYSTATAQERPDLTGATKLTTTTATTADLGTPYVAPNGMHNRAAFIQAGGGTSDSDYAKYVNAVNAVINQGLSGNLITPSSVNSTGKDLPSTKGPVTMEKPRVDSLTGSILAMGAANFGANTLAGPLSAMGFTNLGAGVLAKANAIASVATAAQGPEITADKKAIDSAIAKVGKSENLRDAAVNVGDLVKTLFKHPRGFGVTVAEEVVEEVLQMGALKGLRAGFSTKELITSALENGCAAYNETFAN
ncbi:MAG: hypothetical protein ACO3CN_06015, partial [Candidatus Nanopelagicales bacterium]